MRIILSISLLIFSLNCFAQTETKEEFLNEVDTTFVWSRIQPYYLLNRIASTSYFKDTLKNNCNRFIHQLKKYLDDPTDTLVAELIKIAATDTISEKWDFKQLRRAVVAIPEKNGYYHIGKINPLFLNGKKKLKWVKDSLKIISTITCISKPIFIYHQKYAMIFVYQYFGFRNDISPGHFNTKLTSLTLSTIFIYKRIQNRWNKVGAFYDDEI